MENVCPKYPTVLVQSIFQGAARTTYTVQVGLYTCTIVEYPDGRLRGWLDGPGQGRGRHPA